MKPEDVDRKVCKRLGIEPVGWVVRHPDGELEADMLGSEGLVVVVWDIDDRDSLSEFVKRVGGRPELIYPAVSTDPALRYLLEEALLRRGLWPVIVPAEQRDATITHFAAFLAPAGLNWDRTETAERRGHEVVMLELWILDALIGWGSTPSAAICAAVLELLKEPA